MPILIRGSGGGSSSRKYPLGDVMTPTVDADADGVTLRWRDPDDLILSDGSTAEWKGTLVVAKQGSPPVDADDGELVADITERNRYMEDALLTDVGGAGYYYGIFPYTKDLVVNNHKENTIFADGGLLRYTSWADIAAASADGTAKNRWSIGDEKTITLTGRYAGECTFVIADFDHDNLTDGSGKAGITFVSKGPIGSIWRNDNSGWESCYLRYTVMKNLAMPCFPEDVRAVMKTVNKLNNTFNKGNLNSERSVTQDELFIPAFCEINPNTSSSDVGEGSLYPVFADTSQLSPGGQFHIRTIFRTSSTYYWYVAQANSGMFTATRHTDNDNRLTFGLMVMFCV